MTGKSKRPRDANQLAKSIVDIATAEAQDDIPVQASRDKNPEAVRLGRRGGLKGGKARAAKLDAEERQAIARRAASIRWAKDDDG